MKYSALLLSAFLTVGSVCAEGNPDFNKQFDTRLAYHMKHKGTKVPKIGRVGIARRGLRGLMIFTLGYGSCQMYTNNTLGCADFFKKLKKNFLDKCTTYYNDFSLNKKNAVQEESSEQATEEESVSEKKNKEVGNIVIGNVTGDLVTITPVDSDVNQGQIAEEANKDQSKKSAEEQTVEKEGKEENQEQEADVVTGQDAGQKHEEGQ